MSISEVRQEAVTATRLSRQSRDRAPAHSTAIQPYCVGKTRAAACEQPDRMGHGELAYAVYKSTHPSGGASRNRKTDRRVVEEDVSDELLLKNVAKGDKAAMHIMFARHRVRVFRFIQKVVRNPTIAEDIVSQVFLDVWCSANRFEGRARVSTWLISIARFKAITALRERTHQNIDQDNVLGIADAADTPEAALDRKETNGALQAGMTKLSPAHREIIDLFYYREKSVEEVSEMIGIPQATVKSRIFYARKHLARVLVNASFEVVAVRTNVDKAREAIPSRGLRLRMRAESSAI